MMQLVAVGHLGLARDEASLLERSRRDRCIYYAQTFLNELRLD
jgi:hypothetical protein